MLLGLAGVTVLIGPAALRGLGADVAANVAVLAAAVSYACAGIFGRRFRSLSPLVAATGMLTASAVMAVPLALIVDGPRVPARPATWAAVAGLALASTALGYVIYFRLLATAGATNLLLVTFLSPVSALVLGTAVLGERPEAAAFTGMALIFAGLAAVDGRLLALARRRAAIRGSIPA
jgi:drug/metabolite transporter (DMT)-like permease